MQRATCDVALQAEIPRRTLQLKVPVVSACVCVRGLPPADPGTGDPGASFTQTVRRVACCNVCVDNANKWVPREPIRVLPLAQDVATANRIRSLS